MSRRRRHNKLSDDADAANRASLIQITKEKPPVITPFITPAVSMFRKRDCHHTGDLVAFSLWGKTFTFSGAMGRNICLTKAPRPDTVLIVDLAGMVSLTLPKPPFSVPWFKSGPEVFKGIDPVPPPPPAPVNIPILKFDHPDQCAPQVPVSYWAAFNATLRAEYPSGGHVIVACVGGHGRTGTVLASIILAANPQCSAADAIKFVRQFHCECAIESAAQVRYLLAFRPEEEPEEWLVEEMRPLSYQSTKSYGGGYVNPPTPTAITKNDDKEFTGAVWVNGIRIDSH